MVDVARSVIKEQVELWDKQAKGVEAPHPMIKEQEDAINVARSKIEKLLTDDSTLCPTFLRLAFSDAIAPNPRTKVRGPQGSIRFVQESTDKELYNAITRLGKLKEDNPNVGSYVSYADIYQLAGIEAMKSISGMDIKFQHGRTDSYTPGFTDEFKRIQQAGDDAATVRSIFYGLGFNDKEIVTLSSAIVYWMNPPHHFMPKNSKKVDLCNIYEELVHEWKNQDTQNKTTKVEGVTINQNENLKKTESNRGSKDAGTSNSNTKSFQYWKCLISDASFRKHVELFAHQDHEQFSKDYMTAYQKLSELGFQQFPESIPIVEYHDMKHGIAFAVAMTIVFGVVGFLYEVMRT